MSSGSRREIAALVGTVSLCVLIALVAYPGLNSPDSNQTVYQAQQDFALDWWTPFGSLVLRVWFDLGLGIGLAWLAGLFVFVGGAYLLARARFGAMAACGVAAVVVLWPLDLVMLEGLSRDVFSVGFALVAFGCLAWGLNGDGRARVTWFAFAVAAAALAYLCRQNNLVVVFGVVAGIAMDIARRQSPELRLIRVLAVGGVACVAAAVLFVASNGAGRVLEVRQVHPERVLYVYDLAAIADMTGDNRFPAALKKQHKPGWVTPPVSQSAIKDHFQWKNVISLYPNNLAGTIDFANEPMAKTEVAQLRRPWARAVLAHPDAYIWHRTRIVASTLGIPWTFGGAPRPTDADLGLPDPDNYGHPLENPSHYREVSSWTRTVMGPSATVPLDVLWVYLLACTGSIFYLWRRRPRDQPLFLALGLAIWINLAVLFFVAPAVGFRYGNLMIPLAFVLVAWVVQEIRVARSSIARG